MDGEDQKNLEKNSLEISTQSFTFDDLLEKIQTNDHFSYARNGDGEWAAILGLKGRNTDGHEYFDDLGRELKWILDSRPKYYIGLQNLAARTFSQNKEFQRLVEKNTWVDNEIIHHASINGKLHNLFEVLKNKRIVLVGNETLKKVPINYSYFIEIPMRNCWLDVDRIEHDLHYTLSNFDCDVILYCASMMSNVLIDKFHVRNVTQIDMGSALDPYAGRMTRTYHKHLKL